MGAALGQQIDFVREVLGIMMQEGYLGAGDPVVWLRTRLATGSQQVTDALVNGYQDGRDDALDVVKRYCVAAEPHPDEYNLLSALLDSIKEECSHSHTVRRRT